MPATGSSRRALLRGSALAAIAGAAGFAVARRTDAADKSSAMTAANAYGVPMAANAYGTPAMDQGVALGSAGEVPAGGGVVLRKNDVVLTKDQQGTVRAFSAICPHSGCTVAKVEQGLIACPCHGSRFDARTGAVVSGPAEEGLGEVPVEVRDGTVFTA